MKLYTFESVSTLMHFNAKQFSLQLISFYAFVRQRQLVISVSDVTGDNNFGDDRLLYAHGQLWLQRHHIMGRAVG